MKLNFSTDFSSFIVEILQKTTNLGTLSVIGLLFLSLTVEALQGKMCQNSLPSGRGRSLGAKISGGRGRPWGIFFGFCKTGHILLSDSANCTVLRAVVLTQYRRVADGRTDRQTDGTAVGSTALAMRALRRAVKRSPITFNKNSTRAFQRAMSQGYTPPITSSKWGSKCLDLSSFGRLRQ